jgi:hypothetical protein
MILELAEVAQVLAEAAQTVVRAAAQAQAGHLEIMVSQERAEPQEVQEVQVALLFKPANKLLHLHVILAQLAHQDPQALQDNQVMPDQMETQVKDQAHLSPAHQAPRDHPDHPDLMDNQVNPEGQGNQLKARMPDKDNQVHQATADPQDPPDQLDNPDNQVDQEPPDQKDQMDSQERQEMTANQDTQVKLELQEAPVRKVSARNTVLSTVESSSKTEHADVKSRISIQRTRGDLPNSPCPMKQQFPFLLLVAQKTAIYYVSFLYCTQELGSIFGLTNPLFFLK